MVYDENNENFQICRHCATGKKEFEYDKTTLFCNYIVCMKDGKCPEYKPLPDNNEQLKNEGE